MRIIARIGALSFMLALITSIATFPAQAAKGDSTLLEDGSVVLSNVSNHTHGLFYRERTFSQFISKCHGLDDQWIECEVIVMADQYAIHKLNGQVVNYATKLPYGEGIIGFQSETAEMSHGNLRLKEFAEVIPAEQFLKE